jgi:hypothetical protein
MTKITSDAKVSKISVADERDIGAFIPSLLDDYGLNVYEFRIYCRLARRSGSGSCWESVNNMAAACKINRKTVMQAIASLMKMRIVQKIKQPGKVDKYELTQPEQWITLEEASLLPEPGRPGWVYLVEAVEARRYKIGRTNDVEKRVADLSKQSCFPLKVVGTSFVPNPVEFEYHLHKRYCEKQLHGEWFNLDPQDVLEILNTFWSA